MNVRKTYWLSPERGFALLETLIAFVIMAVGLLALLSFHSESQRNVAEAKAQAEAVAVGEGKLQELRSFLTQGDQRLFVSTGDVYTGVNAVFSLAWGVSTDVHTDVLTDVRVAQVTVAWTDRNDVPQSVELSSELYSVAPPDGIERFLQLAQGVAHPSFGGNWSTGISTGTGSDTGVQTDTGQDTGTDTATGTGDDGGASTYSVHFTGTVDAAGTVNPGSVPVGLTGINFSGNYPVVCQTGFPISAGPYSCTASGVPTGTPWTGTISFNTNGSLCIPGGSINYSGTAGVVTNNVWLRQNNGACNQL